MSEQSNQAKRNVKIEFGPASESQDAIDWVKDNPKKAAAAGGLGYLLLKFFTFWLSPSKAPDPTTRCKYCGSDSYGSGCPHSPDGIHMH